MTRFLPDQVAQCGGGQAEEEEEEEDQSPVGLLEHGGRRCDGHEHGDDEEHDGICDEPRRINRNIGHALQNIPQYNTQYNMCQIRCVVMPLPLS